MVVRVAVSKQAVRRVRHRAGRFRSRHERLRSWDTVVARLASPDRTRVLSVIGNAPSLRNPFARQDVQQIGRTLGATYLIIGQLQADGARLRLLAHLIRVEDMKHVWARPFPDDRFLFDAQERSAETIAATVSSSLENASNPSGSRR